ncbi:DNA-formamidopyrimidine glycosylase [Candidatus Wolfebacteria bacterium]|nr:DNA-formamidopyrimidine glycosylase [Candidatus Wolfebacteria bacterium]
MPELPEVQTIVDDLNKKIIGCKITKVWFDVPKLIKKPNPKDFEKQIKDLKISIVKRRGKNILIYLKLPKEKKPSKLLLIHQKMTGHLLIGKWNVQNEVKSLIEGELSEKVNNYIHLILYLDNGQQIALSDLRKFAKILFGTKEEIESLPDLMQIGPEPLERKFMFSDFVNLMSLQKRKIKQVLMDFKVISGIGNIYSDEILYQAKIHPFKPANKLTEKELNEVFLAIKNILGKAVRMRGTSISDFRGTDGKPGNYARALLVYQKEDKPCKRCQTLIKRVKVGGRSAHYCPKCQKL